MKKKIMWIKIKLLLIGLFVVTMLPASAIAVMIEPIEQAFIDELNLARIVNGVEGTIEYDYRLDAAAELHLEDMITNDFFGNVGSDGSMPWDRVAAQGYPSVGVAELLFSSTVAYTVADAVNAWMSSPPHSNAILELMVWEGKEWQGAGVAAASYDSGYLAIVLLGNAVAEAGTPIPEPSTLLLLGSGIVGLGFIRRKCKK